MKVTQKRLDDFISLLKFWLKRNLTHKEIERATSFIKSRRTIDLDCLWRYSAMLFNMRANQVKDPVSLKISDGRKLRPVPKEEK